MRNDSKVDRRSREFVVRTHRVYTPQALEPGREIRLEEQASHYLGRVLRVAAGQRLVLFNGDGHDYAAEVLRPARAGMSLRIDSRLPGMPESPLAITVAQALSRGERMAETLQKCTELGAAAYQLLDTERVEVRLRGDKLDKRMAHWRGVIVSACEQCGRSRVPQLAGVVALDDWLQVDAAAVRLALDPAAGRSLAQFAAGLGAARAVTIVVGPEGGFSEAELTRSRAAGIEGVSLGPRILRTETSAPAAVSVLQALLGDLR
jgi:16S rRNA (uracil1498-N3)-methyltransferase